MLSFSYPCPQLAPENIHLLSDSPSLFLTGHIGGAYPEVDDQMIPSRCNCFTLSSTLAFHFVGRRRSWQAVGVLVVSGIICLTSTKNTLHCLDEHLPF